MIKRNGTASDDAVNDYDADVLFVFQLASRLNAIGHMLRQEIDDSPEWARRDQEESHREARAFVRKLRHAVDGEGYGELRDVVRAIRFVAEAFLMDRLEKRDALYPGGPTGRRLIGFRAPAQIDAAQLKLCAHETHAALVGAYPDRMKAHGARAALSVASVADLLRAATTIRPGRQSSSAWDLFAKRLAPRFAPHITWNGRKLQNQLSRGTRPHPPKPTHADIAVRPLEDLLTVRLAVRLSQT